MSTISRLRRRADFLAAASGRRFHTERMTVQGRLRASEECREGRPAEGVHLGLTITKRVGHATERNRIRRRLRGAIRSLATDIPAIAADFVVIARRPALDAPFETLIDDLRRAMRSLVKPRAGKPRDGGAAASGASGRSRAHVPRRPDPHPDGASTHMTTPGPDTAHGSTDG